MYLSYPDAETVWKAVGFTILGYLGRGFIFAFRGSRDLGAFQKQHEINTAEIAELKKGQQALIGEIQHLSNHVYQLRGKIGEMT